MKHLLFSALLLLAISNVNAQVLPNLRAIQLETKADFTDAANQAALQAVQFLLSTPIDGKSTDRLDAMAYMIKWMTGSPDFSFTLDQQATKFAQKNDDLLALYMAAMTKYVLENKSDKEDQNKIKLNAVRIIAGYVKDPKNNVKLNKELKKLIEAEATGQLENYLRM